MKLERAGGTAPAGAASAELPARPLSLRSRRLPLVGLRGRRHLRRIEQYRALAHNILGEMGQTPRGTLLVTSPEPRDGRTTVALGLGIVLRRDYDLTTIVVDTCMARPALHRLFRTARAPGLTDVLYGDAPLEAAIRPGGEELPDVLFIGAPLDQVRSFVRPDRLRGLLIRLESRYELVIVDGPPMNTGAQGAIVSQASTYGIMLVRANKTRDEQLKQAIEQCRCRHLLGVVLNRV